VVKKKFPPGIPKEGDVVKIRRNYNHPQYNILARIDFRAINANGQIVFHLTDGFGKPIDDYLVYCPNADEIQAKWRFVQSGSSRKLSEPNSVTIE